MSGAAPEPEDQLRADTYRVLGNLCYDRLRFDRRRASVRGNTMDGQTLDGFTDEDGGTLAHAEDVDGIRIGKWSRVSVARVAIVFVVAMLTRAATTQVPFAIVGSGIAGLLKHKGHSFYIFGPTFV